MCVCVGKTSLTTQFVENQFNESYDPTIQNSTLRHVDLSAPSHTVLLCLIIIIIIIITNDNVYDVSVFSAVVFF